MATASASNRPRPRPLITRGGYDWTKRFPWIAEAAEEPPQPIRDRRRGREPRRRRCFRFQRAALALAEPRRLDERIETVSTEIEALALQDDSCQRLMTVSGVGPIISSAMVAAIGNGAGFKRGRDFSAWLGLVPKQEINRGSHDPGQDLQTWQQIPEKTVRAGRTRRSGAAAEHSNAKSMALDRAASKRLHRNMLAIALANKLARIAWAVLARGQACQPRIAANAA